MRTEETVAFDDVECIKETSAALLCLIDDEKVWIPKSQIHDDSEVFDGDDNARGRLVVTRWIAVQRKLV